MSAKKQTLILVMALLSTYFIWGGTYLAIRFGIESIPPFLIVGLRFSIAGALLYLVLRYLGSPAPTFKQWRGAAIIGFLLPVCGNGTVSNVQMHVSSSVAALSIATAPVWMAIFSSFWGHKISKKEWLGIAIGFIGIALLNIGGSFKGDATSAMLLMFAAASWSFGSVWSKYISMPEGLMGAASQMFCGGLISLLLSRLFNEPWPTHISDKSWAAILFLIFLSSIVAYSAYQWLLKNVRPLVASSNTFVNPIVAFGLGIWLANESVTKAECLALAVILIGVYLILSSSQKTEI